jgi:signal peptidase II
MTKRNLTWLIIIAVIAMVLDQTAKLLIVRSLGTSGSSIRVIGDFMTFVLTFNRQGVFGLPIARGVSYFVFPLLGILLVVMFASRSQHFGFVLSYGLILGGAFGNLIDRLFRPQGVVDFISIRLAPLGIKWQIVNPWFIWNIADGCLVVGIILLLVFEIFTGKQRTAPGVPQPAAGSEPAGQSRQPEAGGR